MKLHSVTDFENFTQNEDQKRIRVVICVTPWSRVCRTLERNINEYEVSCEINGANRIRVFSRIFWADFTAEVKAKSFTEVDYSTACHKLFFRGWEKAATYGRIGNLWQAAATYGRLRQLMTYLL